jgi:hypothetical protein
MSILWSYLPSGEKLEYQGILSKDKPFDFERKNVKVSDSIITDITINCPITKEMLMFVFENGLSSSGNSYVLNPRTLINRIYTYMPLLGFALSIPHKIKVENESYATALTTYLTVSLKNRKEGIAAYLIKSIIYHGWENSIYTGYHYISEPRTNSNVMVYTYFRVLNTHKASIAGYQIDYEKEKFSQVKDNSDYTIRETLYEDFESLLSKTNRKVNIDLSQEDYTNLKQDCIFMTVMKRNKITGIIGIKSVLLHVGKVKELCNVARVVYLETLDRHAYHSIAKMIHYFSDKEYAVMSGVCFGELNNSHIKKSLGFATTGKLYLDFYNLSLKEYNRNASEINLLYI